MRSCNREQRTDYIIPKKYRYQIFRQIHSLSHPAGRPTIKLIANTYYWPRMQVEIRKWCRCCLECQRSKISLHTESPLGKFPLSDRFEHVHTDNIILPEIEGYRYIVTFIDRATRWVELKPLKETKAEDIAQAFVEMWVSRHGLPLKLTSDRGPQFKSKLFDEVCQLLGVETVRTTAYNRKSNGIIERMHQVLKASLMCRGNLWLRELSWVLLGLRTVLKEDTGISAAEMVYGRTLRLPGEFYSPNPEIRDEFEYVRDLRTTLGKLRPIKFTHKNKQNIFVHPDLQTTKRVFVRVDRVKKPLEPHYEGPYDVIKRSKKYFVIQFADKQDTVSIDRLKPAYELSPNDEVSEPGNQPRSILKKTNFLPEDQKQNVSTDSTGKNTKKNKRVSFYKIMYPEYVEPLPPFVPIPGSPTDRSEGPANYVTSKGRVIRKPVRLQRDFKDL